MDISLSEKISRLHDIEFYAYISENSICRSHDLWNLLWHIELPIQKLRVLHFSFHPALSDFCQLMEVGIEQFVHGGTLRQSAVTGDDTVSKLQETTATIRITDVLHQ